MRLFSNATTCCTNHQRIDFIKESIVAPNNYEETGHVSFVAPNSKKNYSTDFYFHGFQVPSKMLLQGFHSGRVPLSSRTSPMLLGFFPLFFFSFSHHFLIISLNFCYSWTGSVGFRAYIWPPLKKKKILHKFVSAEQGIFRWFQPGPKFQTNIFEGCFSSDDWPNQNMSGISAGIQLSKHSSSNWWYKMNMAVNIRLKKCGKVMLWIVL